MEINYKECSIEALKESIKLATDYRNVVLKNAKQCQGIIRRLNARFDENPSIELRNKCMEWEYRYFKYTQDVAELTTSIIDMKYEIIGRNMGL